ncbi:7-carboxy-7-deazaguanine synthase QueE [Novosphingobium sp. ERN07]|uniref:7-carboxy-7-deazaguanine synthase QueE n=1 Tax=Novosphingobium sp. ERN07 TaxID=2726187 RepID=UPI0014566548|nr:7-carboxy-7-deazaguanine synthase QueE [Novosphingobium sp. ERN07]NLR72207.1 7-carboxy-7-deazaguanine synthase QueE [Novosphingobium sp. ERN07]
MLTLATVNPGEAEVFSSLQGEGLGLGRPSVFMRLSRCNLACRWCDTAYTWRFEGDNRPHRDEVAFERAENQIAMSEEDAAALILAHPEDRLVITGGEPLLQGAALARVVALLKAARPALHVEIETNGTVAVHPALDPLIDQFNVSPKLKHSGNDAALALVPERLAEWAQDARAWFKFVVASPADLAEIAALQEQFGIASDHLFVMPEGTASAILRERSRWLAEEALERGWRFTDRLHIHLYGDTRGT